MQVEAYKYRSSENMMLKRTYSVNSAVQWGHRFVPIVKRSPGNFNNRPTVTWGQFHDTQPAAAPSPGASGASRSHSMSILDPAWTSKPASPIVSAAATTTSSHHEHHSMTHSLLLPPALG